MPDFFRQLRDDADDIAERYAREAANAATERKKILVRLAQLDEVQRTAENLAGRLSVLKNAYSQRDQPLCPDCALHGRDPSLVVATDSDDPENFDAHICRVCGHLTSVPLRDWGTPSGGWSPGA